MRQVFEELTLATAGQRVHDITAQVEAFVERAAIASGQLNLSILHTSASLLVQEDASPDVKADLLAFFDRLAPMEPKLYTHGAEGRDDMPAHLKTALTATHLALSVRARRPVLGKWQGIFLLEHRLAPRERTVVAHLLGS